MDGSRVLVAAIFRNNWPMREISWFRLLTLRILHQHYGMAALIGPMRPLSFLLVSDLLVVREQRALLTSSRYDDQQTCT